MPIDATARGQVRRRRPHAIDLPLVHGHDEAGGEARARADLYEVIRSPHSEDQSLCPGHASVAVRLGWRWEL